MQHGGPFASPSRYLSYEVIPAHIKRYDETTYDKPNGVLGHINESGNGALALAICTYLIDPRLIPQTHVGSADVVREEFAHDR